MILDITLLLVYFLVFYAGFKSGNKFKTITEMKDRFVSGITGIFK